jgi:predicted RNA-binding Zn ribbon-like protein
VQDFVNTVDRENGVELLDTRGGLKAWLDHRGLDATVSTPGLIRALELREALRSLLLRDADPGPPRAVLQAAARRGKVRPDFGDGAGLTAAATGLDGALGTVVAAAHTAMTTGEWERLKACPRDVCGWAFLDRSPANNATWCSMQVCGNRTKAAAYYGRRRRG